jgi:hypothetical protein
MKKYIPINEDIKDIIPYGDTCSDENGICPFWKPLVIDNDEIIRAKCNLLDFQENIDYQETFLWGQIKICNINIEQTGDNDENKI